MELMIIIVLNIALIFACYFARRYYLLFKYSQIAVQSYQQMIEETRQGNPPFLLNPGVKITKDEVS